MQRLFLSLSFFALVFWAVSCSGSKETLKHVSEGYIFGYANAEDCKPIENATVSVEALNGTVLAQTSETNLNGHFRLLTKFVPESENIIIRVLGGTVDGQLNRKEFILVTNTEDFKKVFYVNPISNEVFKKYTSTIEGIEEAQQKVAKEKKLPAERIEKYGAYCPAVLTAQNQIKSFTTNSKSEQLAGLLTFGLKALGNNLLKKAEENIPIIGELLGDDEDSHTDQQLQILNSQLVVINTQINQIHADLEQQQQSIANLQNEVAVFAKRQALEQAKSTCDQERFSVTDMRQSVSSYFEYARIYSEPVNTPETCDDNLAFVKSILNSKLTLIANETPAWAKNISTYVIPDCSAYINLAYDPIVVSQFNDDLVGLYNYYAIYEIMAAMILTQQIHGSISVSSADSEKQNFIFREGITFSSSHLLIQRQYSEKYVRIPDGAFLDTSNYLMWIPGLKVPETDRIPWRYDELFDLETNIAKVSNKFSDAVSNFAVEHNWAHSTESLDLSKARLPLFEEWNILIEDQQAFEVNGAAENAQDWLVNKTMDVWPTEYASLINIKGDVTGPNHMAVDEQPTSFGVWIENNSPYEIVSTPTDYGPPLAYPPIWGNWSGTYGTYFLFGYYSVAIKAYSQSFISLYNGTRLSYCVDAAQSSNMNEWIFVSAIDHASIVNFEFANNYIIGINKENDEVDLLLSLSCDRAVEYYKNMGPNYTKSYLAQPNSAPILGMPLATVAVIPVEKGVYK